MVITGRRREVLDAAVADLTKCGITATGLQGDVRSPEACQGWVATTVQQFGHLDILVNCAAGNFLANAAELSQGGFKTGKSLCAQQSEGLKLCCATARRQRHYVACNTWAAAKLVWRLLCLLLQ